ncbi:fimbrial protein [Enterobacter hormaechei]|uniref:fimbrial protein n=1 Tax=Enterobacter hormaechei TaxID=158836 RepID=UPI000BB7AB55|nr:fimbrial protein [Enterobacter hormaechei]
MKKLITLVFMIHTMHIGQVHSENLKITGQLVSTPCVVDTIPTINLGDNISIITLGGIGKGSEPVQYQLTLSQCPPMTSSVSITVSGIQDDNNSQLFKLDEGTGFASGAGIEIMDLDHGIILQNGQVSTVNIDDSDIMNRKAIFNLSSRLVTSKLPVVAGQVSASVTADFTYQ